MSAAVMGIVLTGACSSVPAPAMPEASTGASSAPGSPRVSWEVRTGGDFGDARPVCSSSSATPSCVLVASENRHRSLATVRVYLHAAASETRYLGSVQVPFVAGADHGTLDEINMTVPSRSSPVGATVNGLVTRTPGTYTLTIGLDALQAGSSLPVRLAANVPVTVNPATAQ